MVGVMLNDSQDQIIEMIRTSTLLSWDALLTQPPCCEEEKQLLVEAMCK